MMENLSLEVLRRYSQCLLWVSIILPIVAAFAVGTRYYVESEIGKRVQGNLQSKLEQSKNEIIELKLKNEEIAYQEYALYSAQGHKKGIAINGMIVNPTPLDDWGKDFVSRSEGKIICNCSPKTIPICRSVIAKFPQYPFSYYFLSLCLKEKGDSSWKGYAKIAKSIFAKTTKIQNHHNDHDLILIEVNKLLLKK